MKKVKILECALAIGLFFTLVWGMFSIQEQQQLADKVVRLHVIANSDEEADQKLKLKVRDQIIDRATEILKASSDRNDAARRLSAALPELRSAAAEEIAKEGYQYDVTASLEETDFPTKEYDGFTLPAGEYLALRVVIGEGQGRNWWCVVFPPLCTASTSDVAQTAMASGLNEEDVGLITEADSGYVLKFKSVELWQSLKGMFS
ncbi:stage II sporulation protein R [Oscillibacter sp. MSJ-2]|uniref:Stage II sporulation protein R n=1 Tax=Dysosmobacter acutus TaxID=2841504 RepID=A0ABS6F9X3_9FIRM|nr:stage II sporulation protein R [Dysosmobacter acutus]MBU5627092.1 stage II sporulation protein R [Dysosmobacter acutus]